MRARRARPERLAPVPHADTHARLLEAIEAGDTAAEHAARWSLVMTVRALVYAKVHKHSQHAEDIGSALLIRLAENVHKWNPRRGRLTTFSRAVVMSALSDGRELRSVSGPIVTVPCVRRRLVRLSQRYSLADAAAQTNRSPEAAARMLAISTTRIDAPAPNQRGGRLLLLHEVLADTAQPSGEHVADAARRAAQLRAAVALLEDRPRVMLERFYGLGRPRESSAEIGETEGVTRQRIDQILKQARAELAELLEES